MAAQKYLGAETISALRGKVNEAITAAMATSGGINWSDIGFQNVSLPFVDQELELYRYNQIGDDVVFEGLNPDGTYLINISEASYGVYFTDGSTEEYGKPAAVGNWDLYDGNKRIYQTSEYQLYTAYIDIGERQGGPFMPIILKNPPSTLKLRRMVSGLDRGYSIQIIPGGQIFLYRVA